MCLRSIKSRFSLPFSDTGHDAQNLYTSLHPPVRPGRWAGGAGGDHLKILMRVQWLLPPLAVRPYVTSGILPLEAGAETSGSACSSVMASLLFTSLLNISASISTTFPVMFLHINVHPECSPSPPYVSCKPGIIYIRMSQTERGGI